MFEVQNQPPPLDPYNLFGSDIVLREAVRRENAEWAEGGLNALGATLGRPETVKLGFDANKFPPQLRTLDRLFPLRTFRIHQARIVVQPHLLFRQPGC